MSRMASVASDVSKSRIAPRSQTRCDGQKDASGRGSRLELLISGIYNLNHLCVARPRHPAEEWRMLRNTTNHVADADRQKVTRCQPKLRGVVPSHVSAGPEPVAGTRLSPRLGRSTGSEPVARDKGGTTLPGLFLIPTFPRRLRGCRRSCSSDSDPLHRPGAHGAVAGGGLPGTEGGLSMFACVSTHFPNWVTLARRQTRSC